MGWGNLLCTAAFFDRRRPTAATGRWAPGAILPVWGAEREKNMGEKVVTIRDCRQCYGSGECFQCSGRGAIPADIGGNEACHSCGGGGRCILCSGRGEVAHGLEEVVPAPRTLQFSR